MGNPPKYFLPHLFIFLHLLRLSTSHYSIGVNYGMVADNLPPPSQVATFLKDKTTIDRIKLFDSNPDVLQAFANTGISITVSVINSQIPSLYKLESAQDWIKSNIQPFYPQTKIIRIAVGNEVMATSDKTLIVRLLPAMKNLYKALEIAGITDIQVSTPHSLGILSASEPPSSGRFRRVYDRVIYAPILKFHNDTKSPFMINPYPYFGFTNKTLNYALFKPNSGIFDKVTGKMYKNMFDAQLDAVYSAMNRLGFGGVDIVVAETGWPSFGDPNQPDVNLENAVSYNGNLVRHVNSGVGTPLMPNRTFETYIFSLFNENLKPLNTAERNFGLFRPDFTPVYDVGILGDGETGSPPIPTPSTPAPSGSPASPPPSDSPATPPPSDSPTTPSPSDSPATPAPSESPAIPPPSDTPATPPPSNSPATQPPPSDSGTGEWCIPKPDASDEALQSNIDYVCKLGIDCEPIQDNGACYNPNTVRSHAAFAMNAYYQTYGHTDLNCDFASTGLITSNDPSYDTCKYVS